jgi:cyanophycinase-like exopeptidase
MQVAGGGDAAAMGLGDHLLEAGGSSTAPRSRIVRVGVVIGIPWRVMRS